MFRDHLRSLVCDPVKQILLQSFCLHTLTGHTDVVRSLVAYPDGVLASGSFEHTIKLWSTDTEACLQTLTGHTDMVRSLVALSNGVLASGSFDRTIKLWI